MHVSGHYEGRLAPRFPGADPPGDTVALTSFGSIAAPLLAGFSITIILFTVQTPASFRYPSLVQLVSSLVILLLLFSMQSAFHAQRYTTAPSEFFERFPADRVDDPRLLLVLQAYEEVRQLWSSRATRAFNYGMVLFLVALLLVLAPATRTAHGLTMPGARWTAMGVAALGVLLEVGWMLASSVAAVGWRHVGVRRVAPYDRANAARQQILANFWSGEPLPVDTSAAGKRFTIDKLIPTANVHLVAVILSKERQGSR